MARPGIVSLTIQFATADSDIDRAAKLNRLTAKITEIVSAINANTSVASSSTSGVQFAAPTALIGLAAQNGAATTAMRSDAAPALSQAIQPVWSQRHVWNVGPLKNQLVDAILLTNTTSATSLVQQNSPLLHWSGQGWTGALTSARDFAAGVRPVGVAGAVWALSSNVGAGYNDVFVIDQAGNITDSTWQAQVIQPLYGGTGLSAYAIGDLLYASGTAALSRLAGNPTSAQTVLTSTGTGSAAQAPQWSPVSGLSIGWSQITGAPPIPVFGLDDDDYEEQIMSSAGGGAGTVGPPGPTGAQGPAGPPLYIAAEDGYDGEFGPPGNPGANGTTGAQGPIGPGLFMLAEDGIDGDQGQQGAGGATGAQGPIGPVVFLLAEDGAEGAEGQPGIQGVQGATGNTGAQGSPGPALYMVAEDGYDGDAGPPGMAGINGSNGSTGAQGPAGPAILYIHDDPAYDEWFPYAAPTVVSGGGTTTTVQTTGYVNLDDGWSYAEDAIALPVTPPALNPGPPEYVLTTHLGVVVWAFRQDSMYTTFGGGA